MTRPPAPTACAAPASAISTPPSSAATSAATPASSTTLAGTVSVDFTIGPTGAVPTSRATGVDSHVSSCMAAVISAITFPEPRDARPVQCHQPITVSPPPTP